MMVNVIACSSIRTQSRVIYDADYLLTSICGYVRHRLAVCTRGPIDLIFGVTCTFVADDSRA